MSSALSLPPVLEPGSNVRVISPASPLINYVPDRLARAERALTDLGLKVSYGKRAFAISPDGAFAGTPQERAADLTDAFEDPSVHAIFCSDAGTGSRDLVPLLDAKLIRQNPKPFIGYSDNIFINQFLASRAGLSSFFGYTFLHHMGEVGGAFEENLECFREAVMSANDLSCRPVPSRTNDWYSWVDPEVAHLRRSRNVEGGFTWIREGRAEGHIIGASLSALPELIRMFDMSLDSAVLFWDVNLFNYTPIYEQLEVLQEVADISKLSGMVIGAHQRLTPHEWADYMTSVINDILPNSTFPVMVNSDISHLCPSWLIPYGAQVVLGESDGLLFPRPVPESPAHSEGWSVVEE